MKRIGIIGVGATIAIANFHEAGIQADGRGKITAVYSLHFEKAQRWVIEKNLKDCKACESLDEFYSLVDAVIICTPTATHLEYILQAIAHNKDFFIEKPLVAGIEEAKIATKAIEGTGLVGFVGFVNRYSCFINKIKELVETRIGKVYTYTCYYGGKRLANPQVPFEWRFKKQLSGHGAIADFGAHVIDTCMYICGFEFEKVCGFKETVIKQRDDGNGGMLCVENDDASVFNMVSKCGGLSSFTVSRVGQDEMHINIVGEGGMLTANGRTPDQIMFWDKKKGGAYTGSVEIIAAKEETFFSDWFKTQMSAFISALYRENLDYPSLAAGYTNEKIISAAVVACEEARVVEI